MQVKVRRGGLFDTPQIFGDATYVVACTDQGTPVAIILDINGHVAVKTVEDSDFRNLLGMVGEDKLVEGLPSRVEKINPPRG